ncbi:quinolinate synthase, chloroplastic-like isoform X2 [Hordeum vulgare subsp. vulgare]|uniref:quinolinate synthase, chloroplastic-like isoform X2 n=1 Tax=Hordeum vulgare subsp. vulgare TaxID=112509 RepID=UPI000B46DB81|nr:quinolinate synthase, chloroplastic-like isoform X2 [Hordeum vulgare subsp. vulgare]
MPPHHTTSISMDASTLAAVASFVVFSNKPHLLLPLNPSRSLARTRGSLAVCCSHSHASPPPSPLPCTASDDEEVAPPRLRLRQLSEEFGSLPDADRARRLLAYAAALPPLPQADRVAANRVMGCVAQVWLLGSCDRSGRMRFAADSDSELSRGYCSCLVSALDGAAPEEVLDVDPADLAPLGVAAGARSRVNTWHNVLVGMQKRARAAIAAREGRRLGEPFPSLVIGRDGAIRAQGSYAEAKAKFLSPDQSKISELVNALTEKEIGIVAHFYMDPEVQGILTAAKRQWPHIHISDSLVMADSAVQMAEAGCKYIAVLGVDFMSENVRAILDQAGFIQVGVYRMSSEQIGCSLADAASSSAYTHFLKTASRSPPSLHVIYINTSLETKARTHELVPTITCTSSNVVATILQAFAEIPDLNVWYGPDSYMGANIADLFKRMTIMSDEEITEIHPDHNRKTISSLLRHLHYYQNGNCIVHDMFGHEVVEKIKEEYCDAFLTAHFEVPGEMFSLSMEAKMRGMGVVGSTQNILDFIKKHLKQALDRNVDDHLQFVLGTESGMITSIVAAVRQLFDSYESSEEGASIEVEIVFPVSSDAISKTSIDDTHHFGSSVTNDLEQNSIVPGVFSGEGCSIHGGCASCPYMKMNSLESLLKICQQLPGEDGSLSVYQASRLNAKTSLGKLVAEVGCEPILHMRHFQTVYRNDKSDRLLESC